MFRDLEIIVTKYTTLNERLVTYLFYCGLTSCNGEMNGSTHLNYCCAVKISAHKKLWLKIVSKSIKKRLDKTDVTLMFLCMSVWTLLRR